MPETCVPTSTDVTGSIVPVAVTATYNNYDSYGNAYYNLTVFHNFIFISY